MHRPLILIVVASICGACSSLDAQLARHREKLESLGATTRVVGEAWLGGKVSGTFTRTALEQTHLLVEQERTTFASAPEALIHPQGAQLSQAAEQLSRLVAVTMHDIETGDAASVRRRLEAIPIVPSRKP